MQAPHISSMTTRWETTRWERRAGRAIQVAVGAALVVVGVAVVATPLMSWLRYDRSTVAVVTVVLLALTVGSVALLARRRTGVPQHNPRREVVVACAFAAAASAVCAIIAASLVYRSSWDVRAVEMASAADPVPAYLTRYFGFYPNNIPLLAVARVVRSTSEATGLSYAGTFVLLNGLCLAITLISVYAVGRLLGSHRAGMVAQVLTVLLVGLSPWTIVPYTDYLAMPAPIAATALLLLAHRETRPWARWVLVAVAVVLTGVGIAIKPTVAVLVVAVAVVGLLAQLRRPRLRPLLASVLIGTVCLGGVLGVAKVGGRAAASVSGLHRTDLARTPAVTPLTFAAGGLIEGRSGESASYGIYNAAWAKELLGLPPEEMNRRSRRLIGDQLRAYGVARTVRFEWDKARFNWGDGMFWAWGEGHDRFRPVLASTPLTPTVKTWNHPTGAHFDTRTDLTNAVWFAVLIVAGLGLVSSRYRRGVTVLALCTLGIALFTLVFQGRSRYLFVFVPVVITLAALGTHELDRLARELWVRRSQALPVEPTPEPEPVAVAA